jgi:hypothetical protein
MANEFIVRKGIKSLGGVTFPYTGVTDNCTIGPNEYLINAPSGTFTITLPTAVGISGKQYIIKNSGNGVVTLNTTSSQTIDGSTSLTLTQNDTVEVISDGSNWKIVSGVGDIVVEGSTKSGYVTNTFFTGTPLTYTVTLSPAYPDAGYSVVVTGGDARSWTVENVVAGGFKINSNSNTPLTGDVYWIASLI